MNIQATLHAFVKTILSLAFLAFVAASANSAQPMQKINQSGCTKFGLATQNIKSIQVEICSVKLGNTFPYKGALLWGGDVGELPGYFLTSVRVNANRKSVYIPLSAYGDLGDVHYASIETTQDGFRLNLHGGETATGYDVKLDFKQGYLVNRVVELREFPKQVKETTSYSFIRSDENM